MKFRALQENLRKALRERIEEGELTGLRLARDTGFKQAHISNFLNRKRAGFNPKRGYSACISGQGRQGSNLRPSVLETATARYIQWVRRFAPLRAPLRVPLPILSWETAVSQCPPPPIGGDAASVRARPAISRSRSALDRLDLGCSGV